MLILRPDLLEHEIVRVAPTPLEIELFPGLFEFLSQRQSSVARFQRLGGLFPSVQPPTFFARPLTISTGHTPQEAPDWKKRLTRLD